MWYKNLKHKVMKTTEEKVIARLVKNGNNENDAKMMVKSHFQYVSETYKHATTAKAAEIISYLSAM